MQCSGADARVITCTLRFKGEKRRRSRKCMPPTTTTWYQSGARSQSSVVPLGWCKPVYRSAPAISQTRATFAEKRSVPRTIQ